MNLHDPPRSVADFWKRYDEMESRLSACLSERMLDLARVRAGIRVLDIASGRGEPALRAARRLGPRGFLLGVDVSDALLDMARQSAAAEGLGNVVFSQGNAESRATFTSGDFHVATSRWGLMYMNEPVAALIHAREALVPRGVLVAAVWAEPERVNYYSLPRQLLLPHRSLPPLQPETPGTFRYADVNKLTEDLARAGFAVDHVEEMHVDVVEADSPSELIPWMLDLGLRELLGELSEEARQTWQHELVTELDRSRVAGKCRLGGTTTIVRARAVQ